MNQNARWNSETCYNETERVNPITCHSGKDWAVEVQVYFLLHSTPDEDMWSKPRSVRFTPAKYPVVTLQKAGFDLGHSGRVRECLPAPVFELRNVQIVASRYADCAIPAHRLQWLECFICLRGSAKIGYALPCSKSNVGYQLRECHWVCLVKRSLDTGVLISP